MAEPIQDEHSSGSLGGGSEGAPRVSVVLAVRDPQRHTACLESLRAHCLEAVEIVSLPVIESCAAAWNAGAEEASGDILVFLKDDVRLEAGALESTVGCFAGNGSIGAVGAMLVDSDGTLLEAGSIVASNGQCRGIGRGWNPDDYRAQFRKSVAFCSGAYLAVTRSVFESLGGFDLSYQEEYYEDVDLCLRIRSSGKQVVYDPASRVVRHAENPEGWVKAAERMEANRETLLRLRGEELAALPEGLDTEVERFFEAVEGRRILWVEDAPVFAHMGAGFPRTREMLLALLEMGHRVTLLPTFITASDFADVYRDTPRAVEVALGIGTAGFGEFWARESERFDAAIVSRPNNLSDFGRIFLDTKRANRGFKFIYDAEAVFANREISERRCQGETLSESEVRSLLEAELSPAKEADAVLAISEQERQQFRMLGFPNVAMLRHHSRIAPTRSAFGDRRDFLFVGAVHADSAPNALGLIDFIDHSLPLIQSELGADVKLYCAGKYNSEELDRRASDSAVFLGFVEDLDEWYDRCRVFVAPAKFAAGIPLKIVEAASRGIPVVGTTLASEQLGWSEAEMLSADSDESMATGCVKAYTDSAVWERLRTGALDRARRDYDREHIAAALRAALA